MNGKVIPDKVFGRALSKVVGGSDGCLLSTYSTGSHGYAQIGWFKDGKSQMRLVHRVVWELSHGPIPDGMTVDHVCKNRTCVNIEHLRLLSNFENARRTSGRDWPIGECLHGHPNSELITRSGKKVCRPCSAQWQRDYRARRRAA